MEPEHSILNSTETINNVQFKTSFTGIKRTVTFNPNYNNSSETIVDVEYNEPIGKLPILERKGFTFDGWFTSINEGEQITESTVISENITLYAHWTEIFIAQINNTKYKTLNDAVDSVPANNTETTITLLHDTTESISISSNKNIILNMQNYTITTPSNKAAITNSGTIKILNGNILSSSQTNAAINNNSQANLKLSNINITTTGERQAIYNKGGQVEIKANTYLKSNAVGKTNGYTLDRGTIQNIENGTIIIAGGTVININQQAISNEGKLIIGTKDSTINRSSPILIGKDYGVKNIGTFKFYDGTIKGYTDSISGEIAELENNSKTKKSTEIIDGLEYKTTYLISNN